MMAFKNSIAAVIKTGLLLLFASLQSCSTYNSKTNIEGDLFSGDFDKAMAGIDSNKFLSKDRNKLLYLMEKGKIEHLRGNYDASNALLEEAHIMIEDKIKTNAGQAIAAKFTNPMAEPYKGEDFEKVTIHYYMALNYFHLGMPNEALVEAKRINLRLYELNEKYANNKNKYSEDAFSQILQGLIYESTGDINNAFIAYRNAEEIYNRDGGKFFGTPMPEQLKHDLVRTSKMMGFREEYETYSKKYNYSIPKETTQPAGEAIIFWENGLGPAKDQIILTLSNAGPFFYATYMDDNVVEDILIPIPTGTNIGSVNAIAIPKYRKRQSYYGKAAVVMPDGSEQPFETGQDFYPIAKQCLKDRMLREVVDLVVRFAAKKAASAGLGAIGKGLIGGDNGDDIGRLIGDIAGAATENADTRNWQSLPQTIGYTRISLKEGENKFILKKYGPLGVIDIDTLSIPFKKGLQIVNYFDLGRTQIIPASPQPSALTPAVRKDTAEGTYTRSEPAPGAVKTDANKPVPVMATDAKVLSKYDKWIEADKGISYKVSYTKELKNGVEYFVKKVHFTSTNTEKLKITYTVTEKPFSDKFRDVFMSDYEKAESAGEAENLYYTYSERVKPNIEASGYTYFQKNPDFYVTILNVEYL